EGRAACVHEAKPLLALMPAGTLRMQIEREFARLVKLTPEELAGMLEAAPETPLHAAAHDARQGEPDYAEPPGFMDMPSEGFVQAEPWENPPGEPARGARRTQQRSRAVTPMAKRLLRLLLAHPELVDRLGDQQLEILEQGPHLVLVRDLIALAHTSGARHVGALLQAADPAQELTQVLNSLSTELLEQEDLPDPWAEWNDALHRIELETIKAEQSELIAGGLRDDASRLRYQEL